MKRWKYGFPTSGNYHKCLKSFSRISNVEDDNCDWSAKTLTGYLWLPTWKFQALKCTYGFQQTCRDPTYYLRFLEILRGLVEIVGGFLQIPSVYQGFMEMPRDYLQAVITAKKSQTGCLEPHLCLQNMVCRVKVTLYLDADCAGWLKVATKA